MTSVKVRDEVKDFVIMYVLLLIAYPDNKPCFLEYPDVLTGAQYTQVRYKANVYVLCVVACLFVCNCVHLYVYLLLQCVLLKDKET